MAQPGEDGNLKRCRTNQPDVPVVAPSHRVPANPAKATKRRSKLHSAYRTRGQEGLRLLHQGRKEREGTRSVTSGYTFEPNSTSVARSWYHSVDRPLTQMNRFIDCFCLDYMEQRLITRSVGKIQIKSDPQPCLGFAFAATPASASEYVLSLHNAPVAPVKFDDKIGE